MSKVIKAEDHSVCRSLLSVKAETLLVSFTYARTSNDLCVLFSHRFKLLSCVLEHMPVIIKIFDSKKSTKITNFLLLKVSHCRTICIQISHPKYLIIIYFKLYSFHEKKINSMYNIKRKYK